MIQASVLTAIRSFVWLSLSAGSRHGVNRLRRPDWLLALPLSCLLSACGAPARKAETRPQPVFMWEVRSASTTNYLLGSIHFAREDLYPLPERIDRAFARSKYVVVEANLNQATQLLPEILARAFYQDGDRLENHLSAEAQKLVEDRVAKSGLPLAGFSSFKPWFLAFSLLGLELQKLGVTPQHGIDLHFLNKAGDRPVLELESALEQVRMLDEFSDAEQEALLLSTLNDLETASEHMNEMIESWKSGDARRLEAFLIEQAGADARLEGVYRKLLGERNQKMLARIEGYLKTGETHFVIVGAGHLVGNEGLVELLKKKGYRVRQY